jgi:ABC-type proline/glycine betaine transport system permease subunit
VASAVNNAVARAAGLLAVATLPVVAGLAGSSALSPETFSTGFQMAMWISAALVAAGGLGDSIFAGLRAGDTDQVLAATGLVAALALAVDGGLALVERVLPGRRRTAG